MGRKRQTTEAILEAYAEALGNPDAIWVSADDPHKGLLETVEHFRGSTEGGVALLLVDDASELVGAHALAEALEAEDLVAAVHQHDVAEGALLIVVVLPADRDDQEDAARRADADQQSVPVAEPPPNRNIPGPVPRPDPGMRQARPEPTRSDRSGQDRRRHAADAPTMKVGARPQTRPVIDRSPEDRAVDRTPPASRIPTPAPAPAPRRSPPPPEPQSPPARPLRHTPVSPSVQALTEARFRDLDPDLVRRVVANFDPAAWEPDPHGLTGARQALHSLGAAAFDAGGRLVPSQAGMLVLGSEPSRFVPAARVVVHVDGGKLLWRGSLPEILRHARDFIPLTDRLGEQLVSNLVLHAWLCRLWRGPWAGKSIHLRITDDGFRLRYPGFLAGETSTPHEHADPALVEIAGALGLQVTRAKLVKALGEQPGMSPGEALSTTQEGGWASWTVAWSRPTPEPASVSTSERPEKRNPAPTDVPQAVQNDDVAAPISIEMPAPASGPDRQTRPQREDALVAHLQAHGAQTTQALVADLGWTRSTVRAVLAGLVEGGRVQSEAASTRSPFQRYVARL